jgi:hypothetical protein
MGIDVTFATMTSVFRADKDLMLTRIVFLLLLLISGSASASLLSQQGLPAQYMQTTEDAAIWAQVGNEVVNVGNVRAGQIIAVVPTAADYYEFRFGLEPALSTKVILKLFRENSV